MTEQRLYNPGYWGKRSTEDIQRQLSAAIEEMNADIGKRYRARWQIEAQRQKIERVQMGH